MVLVGRYRAVMMKMMVSRQLLGFCPPGGFIIANFWQGNMHDFQIPLHLLCAIAAKLLKETNKQLSWGEKPHPTLYSFSWVICGSVSQEKFIKDVVGDHRGFLCPELYRAPGPWQSRTTEFTSWKI